jgi:hypothetical protein
MDLRLQFGKPQVQPLDFLLGKQVNRLFLDRVGRHQSPSPLHRRTQNKMMDRSEGTFYHQTVSSVLTGCLTIRDRRRTMRIPPSAGSSKHELAPKHLAGEVWRNWREPAYEEFRPRTVYSFQNAFTSSFKLLEPVPLYRATTDLGRFLQV